jgi:hypothetical protein
MNTFYSMTGITLKDGSGKISNPIALISNQVAFCQAFAERKGTGACKAPAAGLFVPAYKLGLGGRWLPGRAPGQLDEKALGPVLASGVATC